MTTTRHIPDVNRRRPVTWIDAVTLAQLDRVLADWKFVLVPEDFDGPKERTALIGRWWASEAERVVLAWTVTAPVAMLARHAGVHDAPLDGGF